MGIVQFTKRASSLKQDSQEDDGTEFVVEVEDKLTELWEKSRWGQVASKQLQVRTSDDSGGATSLTPTIAAVTYGGHKVAFFKTTIRLQLSEQVCGELRQPP